jgi:beta-galactosidase
VRANGQDLVYVTIEAIDRRGVWQPNATPRVTVSVDGPGVLAGLGSGDLTSFESYAGTERTLYQGRALAVIRATDLPGRITVTVSASGFPPAKITLKSDHP